MAMRSGYPKMMGKKDLPMMKKKKPMARKSMARIMKKKPPKK